MGPKNAAKYNWPQYPDRLLFLKKRNYPSYFQYQHGSLHLAYNDFEILKVL